MPGDVARSGAHARGQVMKTAMVASVMVILAGSAAHAFSDYFVVSGQKMIRQKSISAYNTLSTEDLRGAGRTRKARSRCSSACCAGSRIGNLAKLAPRIHLVVDGAMARFFIA